MNISGFGGAQACLNVGNTTVTGVPTTNTFTFTAPAGCAPGAGNGQASLVATPSAAASGTATLSTTPSISGSGSVNAPAFIAATNITCNNCATVTGVPSSVVNPLGTFSPAWMPTNGATVENLGGSPTAPVPYEVSSGTVTLNRGTYYGGICIGAASGNYCVGAHCDPSVASSPDRPSE